MVFAVLFALWIDPSRDYPQLLRLLLGLIAVAAVFDVRRQIRTSLLLTAGGLAIAWIIIVQSVVPGGLTVELESLKPIMSLDEVLSEDPLADVINFARTNTEKDAVFIVPPDEVGFAISPTARSSWTIRHFRFRTTLWPNGTGA